jgi:hypothetical protein
LVYRLRLERTEQWLSALDDPAWVAVTLGFRPSEAGHFVKHNLLVAEFVLRLQETVTSPLQAVFGERYARSNLLLPAQNPKRPIFGDTCIVREDGLRIVVELVRRQRDRDVMEKMLAWGRLLSHEPRSENGVVVVFLNATEDERGHIQRAASLRRCHAHVLSPEVLGAGAWGSAYARSSIFLASWRDWFPAAWSISTDLPQLVVAYSADGTRWARGPLLPGPWHQGALPFSPRHRDAWTRPRQVALDPGSAIGLRTSHAQRFYGVPRWSNVPA